MQKNAPVTVILLNIVKAVVAVVAGYAGAHF